MKVVAGPFGIADNTQSRSPSPTSVLGTTRVFHAHRGVRPTMGTQSLGSRQKKQSVAPAGNASQLVARPQSMPVSTAPDSATESLDDGWGDDSEALPSAIEVKVTSEALAPARVPDFGPLGRIHAVDDQEEPPISRNRSGAGRHASGQEGQTVAAQTLAVVGTTKKAVTAAPRNGVPGGRSGRARQ